VSSVDSLRKRKVSSIVCLDAKHEDTLEGAQDA
jgi:hypothetical protein